jgi:fermentation-respiration switch protein FrsA (DUF1100 family)
MRALATVLLAALCVGCTSVFFQPDRTLFQTPGLYGLDYQPVELHAADGTELFAWFLPARGKARGSVLYLHGNGQNISTQFANVAWMPAAGFNVLALDYRGYGGSQGQPSLPGVQLDIDAALQALLRRPDVDPMRIVVFGQSLGGALAIHYVAHSRFRDSIRALIVDSAFSDYERIGREKLAAAVITWPFQWFASMAIDNRYSPEASVGLLSPIPVLFIHGDADSIVPLHHSQRLFELAGFPKQLWVVPGAGHIQAIKDKQLRARLTEYLVDSVSSLHGAVAATP